MKHKAVVAIVGMPGSGKTIASHTLESLGLTRIRFGDITDEYLAQKGWEMTEKNERIIREGLRRKYGMAAYAALNIPRIERALKEGSVVLDGLYSWEEYRVLKKHFPKNMTVIALYSSPETRYRRLSERKERPLTVKEAQGRDRSEIENIGKAGPIAMADWTVVNEGKGIKALEKEIESLWRKIRRS